MLALKQKRKKNLYIYICTDNSVHIFNYVSSGPAYAGLDKVLHECRLFRNTILRLKILSEDNVSVLKKCFYWSNIQSNVFFLWQKISLMSPYGIHLMSLTEWIELLKQRNISIKFSFIERICTSGWKKRVTPDDIKACLEFRCIYFL